MQFFPSASSHGLAVSKLSDFMSPSERRVDLNFSSLLSVQMDHMESREPNGAGQDVSSGTHGNFERSQVDEANSPVDHQGGPERAEDRAAPPEQNTNPDQKHETDVYGDVHDHAANPAASGHGPVEEHASAEDGADEGRAEGDAENAGAEEATLAGHDDAILQHVGALLDKLAGVLGIALKDSPEVGPVAQIASRISDLKDLARRFAEAGPGEKQELRERLIAGIRELKELVEAGADKAQIGGAKGKAVDGSKDVASLLRALREMADALDASGQAGEKTATAAMDSPAKNFGAADNHDASFVVPDRTVVTARTDAVRPTGADSGSSLHSASAAAVAAVSQNGQSERTMHDRPVPSESERPGFQSATTASQRRSNKEVRPDQVAQGDGTTVSTKQQSSRHQTAADLATDVKAGGDGLAGKAWTPANGEKGEKEFSRPRDGLLASPVQDKAASSKAAVSTSGKSIIEAELSALQPGQSAGTAGQKAAETAQRARGAEVMRQVENGAFKNLSQGGKQLVIRLDPPDLGQVSVILQVRGKEVQAVLRTSNQEASQALNEQLAQLRTQLEGQGLKVTKLEVQTQLADSQSDTGWSGAEQHNRFQEHREMSLVSQRMRTLGRSDELVRDVQSTPHREKVSQGGLDIFA